MLSGVGMYFKRLNLRVVSRHNMLIPLLERLDVLCNHIVKKYVHISVSASVVGQNELESINKLDILHPT